jgi:hypothetical protein
MEPWMVCKSVFTTLMRSRIRIPTRTNVNSWIGIRTQEKTGSGSTIKVMGFRYKACGPNWPADDKTRVADPDVIHCNRWIWIFLHGTATLDKRT